ncbi:hypothetical protein [Bradyrhizobium sp. 2S1]|uniref:hypothetical protein n=1 Tax=Bradyrhizobium sp. 2S1 TaxID=1404429 RepID=UPI00140E94C3|nr:hypothetical protein [Bradyrhizobium sp. 2S1]MCK7666144.1 hypothetical protein [Bradyrhizobium sp. 2S1]
MTDPEFHLVEPPYFQLDEAVDWIEFTQTADAEPDGWFSVLASISPLEDALRRGKLTGFASLDASPVQTIEQSTWTEFDIYPANSDGKIIQNRDEADITSFVVRSFKAYRAAALKDLSQPTAKLVPGIAEQEPGFHRVMDQVVFLEDDLRRNFPAGAAPRKALPSLDKKYATFLKKIEEGRYLSSPAPLTFDEVLDLLVDYLKRTKQLHSTLSSIRKGLKRHYEEVRSGGQ